MNSILSDKKMATSWFSAITLCVLVMAAPAWPQDFRGSITGRVLDAGGLGVPAARVMVTNAETNVSTATSTEQTGDYSVLYLIPGQYHITVTAAGFKTLERHGIEVRVGDKLALDLQLEVGAVTETVNVTSEPPLLETTNASSGHVVDSRRLSELPLGDGNPTMLTRLGAGVTPTGSFGPFNRPFDNFGPSSIRVDGAPGENEYTLDGFPNMNIARKVGYNPPTDAVDQFKIQNSSYDAQSGHTGAAAINDAFKSGTNSLHGTLYEFIRNDAFNANDFFRNRAGLSTRPGVRYNRYGGSVGGPVWIPKLYDGRDKTFFFFVYEGLRDNIPENRTFSVPTDAERGGDLSDLLPGSPIYDPFTATQSGSQINRQQICIRDANGNCKPGTLNMIDPARISPIATSYLQFIPHPNLPGLVRDNFVVAIPDRDTFHSEVVRMDHELTRNQKFFFHYLRNRRQETRGGWATPVQGVQPAGQIFSRNNDGVGYDHVYSFSPTAILDARVGYSRFLELSLPPSLGAFDPATMGFSAQTLALFEGYRYVPLLKIDKYLPDPTYFGGALGKDVGGPSTFNIYSFQPTLTKIAGLHTLRFGYDFRSYRINSSSPGNIAGSYEFKSDFTKAFSTSGDQFGQALASFLLGLPTDGSFIDRNVAGSSYQSLYHALFVHDDWKMSPRLTVNLGVRYEYEAPTTERFNRNIRGFDTSSSNPIEAAAVAAYGLNPDVLPAANFHVRGGYLFADPNHRGIWQSGKGNLDPRVGVAYRFDDKTVLRGGWGVFVVPLFADGTNTGSTFVANQPGFSQATNVVPTNDNGLTFNPNNCTSNCWASPFPSGVAVPPGASLGLATFLGRNISTFVPVVRRNALVQHWTVDTQRELPGHWLLDVGYSATHGSRINTQKAIDAIPSQFLSTQPTRDIALISYLGALVKNPFSGLLPGTSLNSAQIARSQLLRPFPEFAGITTELYAGASSYHSAQVRLDKRFSSGFLLTAAYTWSKLLEQTTFLNDTDTQYEKRIGPNDVTHRIVVNGLWELPFGRGRKWGAKWPRVVEEVAGGWQVGGVYSMQSGFPIGDLGNMVFFGDPGTLRTNISSSTVDGAFPTSGFYFTDAAVQTNGVIDPAKQRNDVRIKLANNIHTFPTRLSAFRGHAQNNWDISMIKKFPLTEQVKLQFRCEAFNLFNHPQFGNLNTDPTSSSFGKITGQTNYPRFIQLGLKLTF